MVDRAPSTAVPTVSIVTPAYNVADFVAETIESVLQQTRGDFEFLIVDDGSTDGTAGVVGRYEAADARIRLFRQENAGIAAARNRALAHARGRYVALLDGDDIWFPTYLAEQLEILERCPEIAVLGANALNLGGACNDEPLLPLAPGGLIRRLSLLHLISAEDSMSILAVVRREVGDRIGWFDPALRRSEDYDLWLRAAAAGFGVAVNTTPLGRYRRRPNSLSSDELTMLRAIRRPLLKLRASRPDDTEVVAAVDVQLERMAHRELVVEARTALVECDMHALAARLHALATTTPRLQYRVAYWLSGVVPIVLPWLYRVKSRLHGIHRRWRRRGARTLARQSAAAADGDDWAPVRDRRPHIGHPPSAPPAVLGHESPEPAVLRFARNITTRYVLIAINLAIGLFMVRYNVQHLGPETYGLWMLVASVTTYFGVLDFGYSSAVVRYVAEYRARRDVRALNEVLSTMAFVFLGLGAVCYAVVLAVALVLPDVFNLAPGQEHVGRLVLLLLGLQVALVFPFTVFGGVINGFERYDLNNVTGIVFNLLTAAVNVVVLQLGYGLLELVAATTVTRILPFWVYRLNAYKVFPGLEIRRAYFRRDRLRELTGFSAYAAVLTWASRLLYTSGMVYVGIFLNTAAVFIYSVAQRIADTLVTLTEQLHTFMLPAVVNRAVGGDNRRQRDLLVRATRLQLAVAMGLGGAVAALAEVLIHAWLGPTAAGSAAVTRVLAAVVVLRAGIAMPATVLQGTGYHRYVAAAASCGAAVNLVIAVPLVIGWGVAGAAAATLIASATTWLLIVPKACRVVDLHLAPAMRHIVLPTAWPALVAVAILGVAGPAIPAGIMAALAAAGLGVAVYIVLFLAFGLDRDERQMASAALRRVMQRRTGRVVAPDLAG